MTVVLPRASASWTRSLVSKRAFDLNEVHVANGVDPGVAHRGLDRLHRLADLRVAADLLGQKVAGVGDADAQARLARARPARPRRPGLRANTVMCGESTPSVPPDMTNAILLSTARGVSARCGARALHKAATAYSRVKSFTPPLPSVFPRIARMDEGSSVAAVDERHQAGNIAGSTGRNPNDVE